VSNSPRSGWLWRLVGGLAIGAAAGTVFSVACCALPLGNYLYRNAPGQAVTLFLPFGAFCGAAGGTVAAAMTGRAVYGLLAGLLVGTAVAQGVIYLPVFPAYNRPTPGQVVPWEYLAFPGALYGLVGAGAVRLVRAGATADAGPGPRPADDPAGGPGRPG
jgi:hypothetical protein